MNENVKRLEEKIAHLERHVGEQDKAMLELAEQLGALQRELKAMRARAAGGPLRHEDEGGGNLPDERPPHY